MVTVLKELPLEGQVFEIKGHIAFLILPKQQTIDKSMPWVWYAPTLPGLPSSSVLLFRHPFRKFCRNNKKSEKWMFDQFLKAGIAIAGVDVGESYGSPKGRALYSELYKELTNKRDFSKKACLLARSRGGLMLYNWAVENPMSFALCSAMRI